LAVETGLNKSTISSLVDELLDYSLIHETGVNSVGSGRPSTQLEINPRAGSIVGVELGVDFVAVALTDFMSNIIWRCTARTDPLLEAETILAHTLKLVNDAIGVSHKIDQRILGLGLSTPGLVDIQEGVLIFAPNLHWRNLPLKKMFIEETGLNVIVENDANAAALAEHLFGAARQSSDFAFVFTGVGIGAGLFLNGQLYRGKNGYAGEIGHAPIIAEHNQTPCHCGNRGCWETYANQYSIIQRVQASLEVRLPSIIPDLLAEHQSPLSIAIIKEAADAGDIVAINAFSEAGVVMGRGFATLTNFLNPEKIILGGPLSMAGEYLIPAIRAGLAKHSHPGIGEMVEITLSTFGTDASLIGAIAIIVDDILSHPAHFGKEVM
jgi:glucokinase-like ROK family protein